MNRLDEPQNPLFSIIVVSLNAGEEMLHTIDSILKQTEQGYEIIVKDGFSSDGSIEQLPSDDRIRLFQQKDKSIYDAMNQAVQYASGEYYLFMNCGDYFYEDTVLQNVKEYLVKNTCDILYGNLYNRKLQSVIHAYPTINAFTCYRNVPCHQTCFYHQNLFSERGYDTAYTVRADYEHFLWCYFEKHANIKYIDAIIANYEGGGFSETKKNLVASDRQHKEIIAKYMAKSQIIKYQILLILSLAPLRKKIAGSKTLSGLYNKVKTLLYGVAKKGHTDRER